MAEQKRFNYEINIRAVRDLLREHQAPFPKFYTLLPGDKRWWQARNKIRPEGQYHHDDDGGGIIFLRDEGYETADLARSVVIHELRHWWQGHIAKKVSEKFSGLYLKRLFIECAVVVVALLMIVLGLLFGCAGAEGFGVLLLEAVALVPLVYTSALGGVLYCWYGRLPLKYAWLEHDAARFEKTNRGCQKWKQAIVIKEAD